MRLFTTLRLRSGQLCLAVLLSGCTSLPSVPAAQPIKPEAAQFALNGRISINHQDNRQSAGLRWLHLAQSDEILLLTPLGQTAARVYRDAHQATLDSGGKHYQADSVESLMDRELGWFLPLEGLHHWVLGMADSGSPAQIERADNGQISVLHQDGWEVRFLHYANNTQGDMTRCAQASGAGMSPPRLLPQSAGCASNVSEAYSLPARLQLSNEALQVQLLIDEWDWNPQ